MKKFTKSSLLIMTILCINACSSSYVYHDAESKYHAYGTSWDYNSVSHHGEKWSLFTGHGIIGRVDTLSQTITLQPDGGELLTVNELLYALQKDGSYRQVNCCSGSSTIAEVYAVDGKMFIHFLQKRENVTDCFVYPAGKPDNYDLPPGEQTTWVDFFGDFDSISKRFYIDSFSARLDFRYEEGLDWKNASIEEYTISAYKHRTPFICETTSQ